MTSLSHEPTGAARERRSWALQVLVPEMWASVAIVFMWLAVLFDAIFGPDIVNSTAGGDHSIVPSAVVVALFASLATWAVARYGFRRERTGRRGVGGGRRGTAPAGAVPRRIGASPTSSARRVTQPLRGAD